MTPPLIIRPAAPADRADLRRAIVELQDYEQLRHPPSSVSRSGLPLSVILKQGFESKNPHPSERVTPSSR
jgi:hypothetical protein